MVRISVSINYLFEEEKGGAVLKTVKGVNSMFIKAHLVVKG